MGTVQPVPDGHYHLLAYTGSYDVPRFLYHDEQRNRVLCAEEPRKTQWAVLFEGVQPPGYFLWRHPLLGRLLDHDRANDTVIIHTQNPPNNRSNQTWTIQKHTLPTPEDPNNYFFSLKPLSGENAGFLTRGEQLPGIPREWDVSIKAGTGNGGVPGVDQRWLLLYIPR